MKYLLVLLLCPFFMASQTQIGDDIEGKSGYQGHQFGKSVSVSHNGFVIAVGSPISNDMTGLVRVFNNISGEWIQIGNDINGDFTGDEFGTNIDISSEGNIVAIAAPNNDENGSNSGKVTVFENIGGIWTQIGDDIYGESSNDLSGSSISLSGNGKIIAIGAPRNSGTAFSSGHVRVYENIEGKWVQIGSDIDGDDFLNFVGATVKLSSDGTILAIASYEDDVSTGKVKIYEKISGDWKQIGEDIKSSATNGNQGLSLDLSNNGKILAIGLIDSKPNFVNKAVQIYEFIENIWVKKGKIISGPNEPYEYYGDSIALSDNGDTIVIGAPKYDTNNVRIGYVQVFSFSSGNWDQVGSDLFGKMYDRSFGKSVGISGDGNTIIIGGPSNDENGLDSGQVRAYQYINNNWTQLGGELQGDKGISYSSSGKSVSLSGNGNIIAIGDPYEDGLAVQTGIVRTYKNVNGEWLQLGNEIKGEYSYDGFGSSVSISFDGKILAIGAPRNDENGIQSGSVYTYQLIDDKWEQIGDVLTGEESHDFFGLNVRLSSNGKVLAVGPPEFNTQDSSRKVGHVRVFEFINDEWVQLGTKIDGNATDFGRGNTMSLSADGSTVGLIVNLNERNPQFKIRVYKFIDNDWVQVGSDIYDENILNGYKKLSIDLSSDGAILAVGLGRILKNENRSGYVKLFRNINSEWSQIGTNISTNKPYDSFLTSVSLSADGNILSVGSENSTSWSLREGFVSVFENKDDSWLQVGNDIIGENYKDGFGWSIDLSADGSKLVVGSPSDNENGLSSGKVFVYDLSAVLSTESFKKDYFTNYPNPVKDFLYLNLNKGLILKQINIYNLQNQYLYSQTTNKIDLSQLSSGIYFIEVETNQGKSAKKIIKE